MRKLLIYELTNGCLSISNPFYRTYCEAAIALHPEAVMLVPEEVLVKCTASARKLFDRIVRDRGLNSSLPCNHFDNIIQRTRERDVHPISKDDFINYLKPSSGKLKLAGKSSFTILMISRKYYMKVGRRYIHVASLLQKTKISNRREKKRKEERRRRKFLGKGNKEGMRRELSNEKERHLQENRSRKISRASLVITRILRWMLT